MLDSHAFSLASYEKSESQVRSYCRAYPEEFGRASGSYLYTSSGRPYLDFLMGCGSLNYGHNPEVIRNSLLDYIACDGIALGLDLHTEAKGHFLNVFRTLILEPRSLDHRLHFTGPTGANAVEAAVKLARKITGRTNVIAFTNGFHGCSLGALSLTGSDHHRSSSRPLLNGVSRALYEGYLGSAVDTADLLAQLLADPSSGFDPPAAIVFETVQGEGGLNSASAQWAQKLAAIAKQHGAVLIVDDIQAGCGRTGSFFSFEPLGIKPDIVTLAKSLSGFGLPMSAMLIDPRLDQWQPGEHNGTFRGNNHAFVTAAAAIKQYWSNEGFQESLETKSLHLFDGLQAIAVAYGLTIRGRGMMQGLVFEDPAHAAAVKSTAFANQLIIEACGPYDEVIKLLPPLTVSQEEMTQALAILKDSISKL